MEKVKRFLGDVNENRKYQAVIFILCMSVVLGIYGGLSKVVAQNVLRSYQAVEDYDVVKYVEEANISKNVLTLSGWCFYKGVDSKEMSIQVFLRNEEDENDVVKLNVKREGREDINEYFDSEVNYVNCGFKASTKVDKLKNKSGNYEIFIGLKYEDADKHVKTRKIISTKKSLRNGKLVATGYKEEIPAFEKEERINEVLEKGTVLVSRSDYDIYLYQYQDKLYWFAGEDYFFEEDATTHMQYQLFTTREDRLPYHRVERGLSFDNIGFEFEEKEIVCDSSSFRVASYDIPQEYPITHIETGYYTESKWVWVERVNLDVRWLQNK